LLLSKAIPGRSPIGKPNDCTQRDGDGVSGAAAETLDHVFQQIFSCNIFTAINASATSTTSFQRATLFQGITSRFKPSTRFL